MYDERLNDKMNSQPANVAASAVERLVMLIKHLFGFHDSSCRTAGAWRLEDNKQTRGPFCCRTKLPLILPKNRNHTKRKIPAIKPPKTWGEMAAFMDKHPGDRNPQA